MHPTLESSEADPKAKVIRASTQLTEAPNAVLVEVDVDVDEDVLVEDVEVEV